MERDILAEPLWDETQTSERCKVTLSYLQAARSRGYGPPFIKVGRLVRYVPQDVRDWLAAQQVRST